MSVDERKIALALAEHRCVLVGEFKLSSGVMSPYYIDLRAVPSYPELFEAVTEAYVGKIKELGLAFDRIAGIATAGIPIASIIAYKLKKPMLYIRKEERAHGTQRMIEGVVREGDEILFVDDVATTGGNLLRGIDAVRAQGAKVNFTIVLVDREQGAGKNLAAAGVKLISITTSSRLMEQLYFSGIISKEDYDRVIDYIRSEKNVQKS
jgi:orotate phosphoribosyltransferase